MTGEVDAGARRQSAARQRTRRPFPRRDNTALDAAANAPTRARGGSS